MPESQIPTAVDQEKVTLTSIPVQYNSGNQTKQNNSLTQVKNLKVQLQNKQASKHTTLEEDEKHFPPGHLSAKQMGQISSYADHEASIREDNAKIASKYQNLSSAVGADKIKALKDKSLDPFKIAGPNGEHAYDGLMNSLQRWKEMASPENVAKMDDAQRDKAAMNYYKGMIVPFYQMMKKDPPPPELWKEYAYTKAIEWDMDKAYKSHWRQGIYEGFKDYENLGKFMLTSLGGVHETLFDLGKGLLDSAHDHGGPSMYSPDFLSVLSGIGKQIHEKGITGTAQARMREDPLSAKAYDALSKASKTDQFWSDINPNENWRQSATSSAVELITQLPLFKGVGAANASLFNTQAGVKLTDMLAGSKIGQIASRMLTYGSEGSIYGYVTRNDADKSKAWQDGIAAGVLGTVFHYAGEKIRLGNLLSGKAKNIHQDIIENVSLAKRDLKIGDADDLEPEVIKQASHTLAAGGLPTHLAAIRSALEFAKTTEGMDKSEIRNLIKKNVAEDPAKWTRVYQYHSYINALMRGKKFSELNEEDIKFLYSRIEHITEQGGARINEHVPEAQAEAGKQSVKNMQGNKNGQALIQETAERLKKEAKEAGLPPRPDGDYIKAAEAYHAKLNAAAAAKAAENKAAQPIAEARDVEVRRTRAEKSAKPFEPAIEDPGYMRQQTRYWTNKKGEPAVSFSMNKEWKSYMQNRVKDAGLKWESKDIKSWLDSLSSEDFAADLKDFAYPKELKEAGIFFESEANKEGKQNPNFLAFMYNYVQHMPKEYAARLSEELEDSVKFEKSFNPKVDIETQKRYYAEAMYNHVNDFLQSGRHPNEANIFRSTLSDLRNPTVWQEQLHNEATAGEIDIIHEMYKRHPEAREAALAAHERLAKQRAHAFKAGKQVERKALTEQIYDNIFSSRERWNF